MMNGIIADALLKNGIEVFGVLPAEEAETLKPPMDGVRSYIIMLLPYHTPDVKRNVARFACFPDYHASIKTLLGGVCAEFESRFKGEAFKPSVDSSPLSEVKCAEKCGLGVVGKNGLLINERFGSYCFIAEIATTAKLPAVKAHVSAGFRCTGCGACFRACPHGALSERGFDADKCVSHVSQKKGQLTPEEERMIASADYIWGCDRCQEACPLNEGAEDTRLRCFTETTPVVTEELINDPVFFNASAFAWRGRNTILRNVSLQKNEKNE
ncbi:MAG: epoxyqueuosine reductase [Clostridia bacterium]|nr:epoxyqueuosine reductase [Clostridia bacterium]